MLSQADADALMAMQKWFEDQSSISMPPGADYSRVLVGADLHERFLMDIWRSTIRLSKSRLQTRARKVVILARVDVNGAPHTNPDGTILNGTHIHLYREGYEARWAYPLDRQSFADPTDNAQLFNDFCLYCNVLRTPEFQDALL